MYAIVVYGRIATARAAMGFKMQFTASGVSYATGLYAHFTRMVGCEQNRAAFAHHKCYILQHATNG